MLPWYALVHKDGVTTGFGVRTGTASLASWRIDDQGVTLVLDVRNGGRGVLLGDRELVAAEVVTATGEGDPFAFASSFCRLLCDAPRLPQAPVYGGNDWYFRYGRNSAETVRADAAVIREHTPESGRPVFVVDDGWFPTEGLTFAHGNDRFPDLPGLAQSLSSAGVDPGIWLRPLIARGDSPASHRFAEEHPLRGGTLDPSVPEVLEQVRSDVKGLVAQGFTLLKHDFSTYDVMGRFGGPTLATWSFADRSRTSAEVLTGLYDAIREAAGDALLIGCNTVGHLGAGRFELQRTGDDTSGHAWERTRFMGVNTLAFRMPQHGAFFAVDADCAPITTNVPWELNRQWLELLGASGTPLFVSPDPAAVGPEQSAVLREALTRQVEGHGPAQPLDWTATSCPREWRLADGSLRSYDWVDPAGTAFPHP